MNNKTPQIPAHVFRKGLVVAEESNSKLLNKRTEYNGQSYDSKAEAARAQRLDYLKAAGDVVKWERQITYKFIINGHQIGTYRLDFRITWKGGGVTHEDVKGQRSGVPYKLFLLKKALMKALHGIEVQEVK